ncbi:helix-turn-helix domain-containing protein [Candidatus Peregrinibacteria bacterium]|nr:helix-turn-helix domain-containing protein [Candidatus Peregrinibacteria bacterium]
MNVLDRKQAADLLKVSVRTVDRYIQRGLLSTDQVNGRIFIKFKDLKPLINQKKLKDKYLQEIEQVSNAGVEESDDSIQAKYSSNQFTEISSNKSNESEQNERIDFQNANSNQDSSIYKRLYEELQEELKQKQERLEGANYRVGQLEGLLKESVPLIEYRKAIASESQKREELEDLLNSFEKDNELLNQTVESKKVELEQISQKLETERYNKKVFVIILIILFLLQPLWLLFPPSI